MASRGKHGNSGSMLNSYRSWSLGLIATLTLVGCDDHPKKNPNTSTTAVNSTTTAVTSSSAKPNSSALPGDKDGASKMDVGKRLAQFVPVELTADTKALPKEEQEALMELIAASKLLDPIFDRQAYANNPKLEETLSKDTSAEGKARLEYFKIMRGAWDRQDHHHPFWGKEERPKGGGFYPTDLTEAGFKGWVKSHPKQKKDFESLFTVIRKKGSDLVAIPFSKEYEQWLKPAADHLNKAAKLTKNKSLKAFLEARAKAFLNDDYYESDKLWMDVDSPIEITIGPYETYEDQLNGYKASFESFVTVADANASKKLEKYKKLLPTMEENLPVPKEVKTKRGSKSPIRVVDLVFSSGDARKSVQTIAFNLPNDERVRKEKGAKKVMLRNIIETKFQKIMHPIAEQVIDPSQHKYLSSEAFFNETLFHELSHSLGPAFVEKKGKEKVEVRMLLGASYSAIEECKADVMGAYNILFMIKKGEFPKDFREKLLLSYFAGLFRSVRFGVMEAHGKGAALQINRFVNEGGATFDEKQAMFKVDFDKLEKAITSLVHDLVMLQHDGDAAKANQMLKELGVVSPTMAKALAKLKDVPVDLRPVYPVAGEKMPTTK
jgi:hypothetical protein